MLKATVQGLQSLRRPEDVAAARGLTVSQVLPAGAKPDEEPEPSAPAAEVAEETAADATPEEPQETESGEDQDQASS
jgi:small subunit ribosomal protein S5